MVVDGSAYFDQFNAHLLFSQGNPGQPGDPGRRGDQVTFTFAYKNASFPCSQLRLIIKICFYHRAPQENQEKGEQLERKDQL